jgi:serine/threonine protein kinase
VPASVAPNSTPTSESTSHRKRICICTVCLLKLVCSVFSISQWYLICIHIHLQDDVRKEAQIMSLIDHPNVIKAYCSFVVDHNLWVIMPFMAEGSCLHLMKVGYPDGLEEPVICSILKETLKALDYLHRQGHIHRDVKVSLICCIGLICANFISTFAKYDIVQAGNILVDSPGVVKLGDFGVSACLFDRGDRQRSRNTFVGTPCW